MRIVRKYTIRIFFKDQLFCLRISVFYSFFYLIFYHFISIKKFLCLPNVYCILYLILYKWGIYNDFLVCSEMTEKSRAYSKVVAYRNCRFSVTKNECCKG